MMIIGSKDKIAIKVDVAENGSGNSVYGKVLLYLASKVIGHFEEPINIGSFVNQFRKLANGTVKLQELSEKSDDDALTTIIENDDEVFDKCILSLVLLYEVKFRCSLYSDDQYLVVF